MSTIGSRLDIAMKEAGFKSQAELSRESGVPQPTISRTLKDKSIPEEETLAKLAVACKVGTEWLRTERGPKHVTQTSASVEYKREQCVVQVKENDEAQWPFKKITPDQYNDISPERKARIEEDALDHYTLSINDKKNKKAVTS